MDDDGGAGRRNVHDIYGEIPQASQLLHVAGIQEQDREAAGEGERNWADYLRMEWICGGGERETNTGGELIKIP